MNDFQNLNDLIDLSEKSSESIKNLKEKQFTIVIRFFILLMIVYIFGYIDFFVSIPITFDVLFSTTVITWLWIKTKEFSRNKSDISVERTVLSKLFNLTHEYKTSFVNNNENSEIENSIIEIKLSRISYNV